MNEQEVLQILSRVGAVITNSHIVYTSGKHGKAYINKDAVYSHTKETSDLCRAIAEQFANDGVEVVIAPAIGGVILSQWVAYHLSEITGREVFSVYAEKERKIESIVEQAKAEVRRSGRSGIARRENQILHTSLLHARIAFCDIGRAETVDTWISLKSGKEDLLKAGEEKLVIKRGYDKLVAGKNVLVVEDILTTGGSAKKVIEATRAIGGNVIGLGFLCNRGGITPEDVANPPKLFALVNIKFDVWDEAECLLCAKNVPVNTDVGKGREYLARKKVS